MYDPDRKQVLKDARREEPYIKKDGTVGDKIVVTYKCYICNKYHPGKDTQVDHVKAVGKQPPWPPTGNGEWDRYLLDLFFSGKENLKPVCKPCHKIKSKTERSQGAYE